MVNKNFHNLASNETCTEYLEQYCFRRCFLG